MKNSSADYTDWLRHEVRNLKEVEHGGEIWKYLGSGKEILDFSSNANPLGPSRKVLRVLRKSLSLISFLPDSDSSSVREAIAEYLGRPIRPSNIIVGNGSTELIHLFALTFVNKGEECIIPIPTFGEYEIAVRRVGGKPRFLRLKPSDGFTLKIDKILEDVKPRRTKAVFICNPNNPTGQVVPQPDIIRLLDETLSVNVMVFLDESYIEFSSESSLVSLVEKYPNLFVLRSLTKVFSLMGLRIGYGVASEELVKFMSKAKISWNVNVLAQIAAVVALKDRSYLEKVKRTIEKERKFLFRELQKIKGFQVLPTKANFFLVNIENFGFSAPNLKEQLLKHGILIRDCSSIRGLDSCYIRISVRRRLENRKLLETLRHLRGDMEFIRRYLASAVAAGKIKGSNLNCEYYPCHFKGQDCTWCFCPFYPCGDIQVGGKWIVKSWSRKIWDCSSCNWIHKPEVAHEVLKEILQLMNAYSDINEIPRKKLLKIYSKVKAKHPPH